MAKQKLHQECPHCAQAGGVDIIYGRVDSLSDSIRSALWDGDVFFGGTDPKWDWEEELIDTKCLRCHHEWHAWPQRVAVPT